MHLRLGWALIRTRAKIDEGIQSLKKSYDLDPTNTDVVLKLAGALLKERSDFD